MEDQNKPERVHWLTGKPVPNTMRGAAIQLTCSECQTEGHVAYDCPYCGAPMCCHYCGCPAKKQVERIFT